MDYLFFRFLLDNEHDEARKRAMAWQQITAGGMEVFYDNSKNYANHFMTVDKIKHTII